MKNMLDTLVGLAVSSFFFFYFILIHILVPKTIVERVNPIFFTASNKIAKTQQVKKL